MATGSLEGNQCSSAPASRASAPAMSAHWLPRLAAPLLLLLVVPLPAARPEPAGSCPSLSDGASCPVIYWCFLIDPVCGEDGVTYWCGCPEAACAGVRVAKGGVCQVGIGGSGPIAGQAFLLLHIVFLIGLGFAFLFDVL